MGNLISPTNIVTYSAGIMALVIIFSSLIFFLFVLVPKAFPIFIQLKASFDTFTETVKGNNSVIENNTRAVDGFSKGFELLSRNTESHTKIISDLSKLISSLTIQLTNHDNNLSLHDAGSVNRNGHVIEMLEEVDKKVSQIRESQVRWTEGDRR